MARRPEILAPAGDLASLRAALAAGADAVYFGLDDGFNARARAENFALANLAETVALVHRAGARVYLTLNTLIFEPELPAVERILRGAAAAGVDAIIVQDPAVALLSRAVCPALELHGSTQMTISSPEGARFAAGLGVTRVVAPRELSVEEVAALAAGTDLELEVFIHGALCVSWSGQCLTSESWGGRSANRGQCAQSCRLPYDLVVDGARRELGDLKYLLSPRDLAGVDAVAALAEIGVHGLKIEGRQKGPQYVLTAVGGYRRWVDGIAAGAPDAGALARDLAEMTLSYSRGFSPGFLGGADHQHLVEGRSPRHRGVYLGRVVSVEGDQVVVVADGAPAPGSPEAESVEPRAGMGVVFEDGHPEQEEPGGPLFEVALRPGRAGWRLGFGRPGPDLRRVGTGHRVWLTGDPSLGRRTERLLAAGEPHGRHVLDLDVRGQAGTPLTVRGRSGGHVAEAVTTTLLAPARGAGLDPELLAEKLGGLGGTPFRLGRLDAADMSPGLHAPVSELKEARRHIVEALTRAVEVGPVREIHEGDAVQAARARAAVTLPAPSEHPALIPLCRTDAQLEAVIAAGLPEVELDWMELVGLGRAVARARGAGLRVGIATVRVQKPGEEGYDGRLARLEPDTVLVRHWGALMAFRERSSGTPTLHGDFSLNVTNSITAAHLLGLGLASFTCAHDLDAAQLFALLEHVPAGRAAVTLHHHLPTFHTEHCVYAHLLSEGRDHQTCGRPCEAHELALEDRTGLRHPVVVDVGCRNTVFNAPAQSAAALVPRLLKAGVRRFRVELVRETREETARVLAGYADLLAGRIAAGEAVRRVGVHEQFGVTRGTMRVLQ